MRVPRPFDPDPEEIEQPQGKESKKHIEREEKPIADENQQQSEDFHGGDESTESMPDSPNEGSEEQEEQQSDDSQQSQNNNESSAGNGQQGSNGEQSQQSNSSSSSENPNSDDKQSSENSGQGESQQSQNSSESQQSSSNESSTSNVSESQQSSGKTESSESSKQSSGEQSEEQSSDQSGDSFESDDNEQEEASGSSSQESNGETDDDSSNASEEGDAIDGVDDTEEQDNDETFDSEEQEEEASESIEETEEQVNSGAYNTDQVFTYTSAKNNTKLSRALYDFIEYIADETKVYNNLSADYYEPKKLMLRRYQGKSLNATKSGKVRETIVVLLDNSGSMDWVREHVLETARALIQRHDAEIYFVPNGYIETQLTKQGNEQVKHENVINKIVSQQLKVLYVGDYDGANTPIELSWKTKVFWLCPESRYRRFRSHDWVSYDEIAFRGFFARTYNANEMVQALKRFAGFAQFTRYWYDPHEREVFQDD